MIFQTLKVVYTAGDLDFLSTSVFLCESQTICSWRRFSFKKISAWMNNFLMLFRSSTCKNQHHFLTFCWRAVCHAENNEHGNIPDRENNSILTTPTPSPAKNVTTAWFSCLAIDIHSALLFRCGKKAQHCTWDHKCLEKPFSINCRWPGTGRHA